MPIRRVVAKRAPTRRRAASRRSTRSRVNCRTPGVEHYAFPTGLTRKRDGEPIYKTRCLLPMCNKSSNPEFHFPRKPPTYKCGKLEDNLPAQKYQKYLDWRKDHRNAQRRAATAASSRTSRRAPAKRTATAASANTIVI